ncbi:MAG TPA: condensation domain-containing protein, partial [Pyrinomonadaceae bacterium]
MSQPIIEGYPLSPQQKHLWSLYEDGGRASYAAQCAILVEGPLDDRTLLAALGDVVERHEILRTSFNLLPEMTMPLQVVNPSRELRVEECDLSGLSEQAQETRVEALLREAALRGSDLEKGDALSLMQVRLGVEKHALLVSFPSLYADTTALKIFMQDLGDCYAARLRGEDLPEEPIQYADLSEWQNESLAAEGSEVGHDYWRRQ